MKLIYVVIYYVIFSELISIITWFFGGKTGGVKGLINSIKCAPFSFFSKVRIVVISLTNPIEGVYRAKATGYFAIRIDWMKKNPGKPFPVQVGLSKSVTMRYPNFTEADIKNFLIKNNVENLIDLVEATIKLELPLLINEWYDVRFKYLERLNSQIEDLDKQRIAA